MSVPPIPPPSAYSCPNCGQEMNEKLAFCPRCGAALNQDGPRWPRILGATVLLFIALPCGASGACFLAFSGGTDVSMLLPATGLLMVTGFLVWSAVKLLKR